MNKTLSEDIKNIALQMEDLSELEGKTVMVTGATGLIGYNAVLFLASLKNVRVIAFVRDIEKARERFGETANEIHFVRGDVINRDDVLKSVAEDEPVDYIIHAACQTASRGFAENPVETINVSVLGTTNMLELAKAKKVDGFLYVSSMEIYGAPKTDEEIREDHACDLMTTSVRACYPESKRMCENLCASYMAEYGVKAKVIRLTQTFGPGIASSERRVFAELARCVIEKRDMVLHSTGETKHNYLYTADAVTAMLTVLLKGENGQAYNAANDGTYCSILEMCRIVAEKCANGEISVIVEAKDGEKMGYAPVKRMNICSEKLRALGWSPTVGLEEMYRRLIEYIKWTF